MKKRKVYPAPSPPAFRVLGGALGRVVDTARDALTLLSSCKNEEGLAPSVPRRVVETEAVLIK